MSQGSRTDHETLQKPPNHADNKSSLRLGGAEIVTINVGATLQPFKIHQPLICNESAFFATAFASRFKEGADLSMSLPDDSSEVFEIFAQWLYTKQYYYTMDMTDAASRRMVQPVQLYIFADKYEIPVLKRGIIRLFFAAARAAQREPPASMIEHVYDNTSRNDELRSLLVDWWWTFRYTKLPLPLGCDRLYDKADFAVDLLRGLARKKLRIVPLHEGTAEDYFQVLETNPCTT